MANLEVQIGADSSGFDKKIKEIEKDIKELSQVKLDQIKVGLDTKQIDAQIKDAKKSLKDLQSAVKDTGASFGAAAPKVVNAGNTLTNFSRIAQDAPFGIMGIGNNLTATAESFASLSQNAGGAGNALKALAGSLMGGGGVLLAISLVTTALTVMSQKGITVGDVFDKLTGNFDQFKKDLQDVNKESAKNSAEEVQRVKTLADVAKDETLTRQQRLIAVQKLQDEYPAYFANLSKEQILNGNVGNAIKDVVVAIKEKAKAAALAGKLTDLSAKEFELRDQETKKIKEGEALIKKINDQKKKGQGFSVFGNQLEIDKANLNAIKAQLKDIQDEIVANQIETEKWANASASATKKSILLEFNPPKVKVSKTKREDIFGIENALQKNGGANPFKEAKKQLLDDLKNTDITDAIIADLQAEAIALRKQFGDLLKPIPEELLKFNAEIQQLLGTTIVSTFSSIGDAIGNALANGGNVIQSVGASLVSSMGQVLSAIGDKLIALGAASLLASTVFTTFGSALGVGAALAAIAGGIALKAGGSFLSSKGQQIGSKSGGNNQVSAGNSVNSPTSSVSSGGSFSSGFQNVVFEISGQSLVGVLSNTLHKNIKLGGTPAI